MTGNDWGPGEPGHGRPDPRHGNPRRPDPRQPDPRQPDPRQPAQPGPAPRPEYDPRRAPGGDPRPQGPRGTDPRLQQPAGPWPGRDQGPTQHGPTPQGPDQPGHDPQGPDRQVSGHGDSPDTAGRPGSARRGRTARSRAGRRSGAGRDTAPSGLTGALVRIGIAVAVMLAAAAVTTVVRPGAEAAKARIETKPFAAPLRASTLVCPESRADEDGTRTRVQALSAPAGLPGGDEPGKLAIHRIDKAGDEKSVLGSVDKREKPATVEVKAPNTPPLVALAEGSLAPGATAGALTRTTEGPLRGLAEAQCISPGAEFWFVGAGSQVGRHPVLYVSNPEDADARIDVTLYDKQGRIDTDALRSLDVAPHTQLVLRLEEAAPTSAELAVHVRASRGRVAAALRDDRVVDGRPAGVDWIPASVPPAKSLVVPGIAGGAGSRVLNVFVPGDNTAVVDLMMLGTNGPFEPAGLDSLEIGPGQVRQIDLSKVTVEQPAALRITADVPVVASLRNELVAGKKKGDDEETDETPVREVAYASAARPMNGPAVVPSTPSGKGRSARIQVSTPDKKNATVDVAVLALDGRQVFDDQIEVPAGGTAELGLPNTEGDKGYVVVVTPREGSRVHGVRILTEDVGDGPDPGPMVSIWPLDSAPVTALRPAARSDLGTR